MDSRIDYKPESERLTSYHPLLRSQLVKGGLLSLRHQHRASKKTKALTRPLLGCSGALARSSVACCFRADVCSPLLVEFLGCSFQPPFAWLASHSSYSYARRFLTSQLKSSYTCSCCLCCLCGFGCLLLFRFQKMSLL